TAEVVVQVYDPLQEYFWSTPAAGNWVYRDVWRYQNRDSEVSNSDGLRITATQWGPPDAWIINTGETVSLEAGAQYYLTFRFRDDAANGLSQLGFTLVNEWDDYGPTQTAIPKAAIQSPASNQLQSYTVSFTAPENNSDCHLAFHLNWGDTDEDGPADTYHALMRDILLSPTEPTAARCTQAIRRMKTLPCTLRDGILTFDKPLTTATRVGVYTINGRTVKVFDQSSTKGSSTFNLRAHMKARGAYILSINQEGSRKHFKIIR
ncbi:MAG: T9SS type A sorting domain-containing protein, partial [Chitinivibrionales bacterium]